MAHPPKVKNKARIDYFDTEIPGFLLEVRSSGKCTFYQRYRDRYGRLRQLRIGPTDCITLEEARQKAKKIRSQAIMGLDPAENTRKIQKTPTFKEFIHDQYIPFVQIHKRSWEADLKMIENRILPLWGSKIITEVNREDVEEFRANFIRAGYKPASANRYLALVKYIFNLAVKWEVLGKSPAKDVKKLAENNQTERYLTADETRRLLDELTLCQSREVADIIEFFLFTGARRCEVVNLQMFHATDAKNPQRSQRLFIFLCPSDKTPKPLAWTLASLPLHIFCPSLYHICTFSRKSLSWILSTPRATA